MIYLAIIPCIAVVLAYACIIAGARAQDRDDTSDDLAELMMAVRIGEGVFFEHAEPNSYRERNDHA